MSLNLEAHNNFSVQMHNVDLEDTPEKLRNDILLHFKSIGLSAQILNPEKADVTKSVLSKEEIRKAHANQRTSYIQKEASALRKRTHKILHYFANGCDVSPEAIDPILVPVESDSESGYVFRLATTLWSIPVSRGFGRRMRYLVLDRSNNKLIGIFALGDPVFNLMARDKWIGWNAADRWERLVNVMDAYIVGAIPPYSHILGGKLVTALIGSKEVSQDFASKYKQSIGIISNQAKNPQLVLVTVTSALGRSSIYNRFHLRSSPNPFDIESPTLVELKRIGTTLGYGHFHLDGNLFERLRRLLVLEGHPYANGHKFGNGPNWRMRVARVGLERVGLNHDLVRHGIKRDVYAMPLAENFIEVLQGKTKNVSLIRPTVCEISKAAMERWIIRRAFEKPDFRSIHKGNYLKEILSML